MSTSTGSPSGTRRTDLTAPAPDPVTEAQEPLGAIVHRLTEQVPELIRSEMRLAQAEMAQKGKRAGIGLGMFSAAGLLAFFGLALLLTTAVLALALVLPPWASVLIVAGAVLAIAAIAGLVGKNKVQSATPPKPERTMVNVKEDVETLKGHH